MTTMLTGTAVPTTVNPPISYGSAGDPAIQDVDAFVAEATATMSKLARDDATRTGLRDETIRACLPLAHRLARRFAGRGENLEDLSQVAVVGLIKAVDRFEPARGIPFSSYAAPTVIGELKRHFRDKGWSVRVSRRLQERHLEIARILPQLAQDLGRTPSVVDIAERLDVTAAEVLDGLSCGNAYATRSLSSAVGAAPAGSEGTGTQLGDVMGGPDEALEAVPDRQALRQLLCELPERERRILALRFFANLTQTEIAHRVGISQMHVSRLLTRTLAQLRERLLAEE